MSKVSNWKFYTSTESSWDAMIESFRRARTSIDLVQFVFGHDGPILETLAPLLTEKVSQGVRVRLLLDAIGSFSFFNSSIRKELEEAGVEIIFHKTLVPPSFKRIIPAFLRDHRKLIIVDGKEAHIGGVIIQERARSWRDTNVVIEGPIVDECIEVFEDSWKGTERKKPLGEVVTGNGRGEFYLTGNSFRLRDKSINSVLIKNIATARKSVYITTPYFALTHDLRRALLYAEERGVEIYLLLPRRSDNLYSDFIGRFFYKELLSRNIRIFHYTKSILHAKTTVVDGKWSTIGSCNLDWLSLLLNYELNLVSENENFAHDLETTFFKDLAESEEVTAKGVKWYGFFTKAPA